LSLNVDCRDCRRLTLLRDDFDYSDALSCEDVVDCDETNAVDNDGGSSDDCNDGFIKEGCEIDY
jgi:hypothetical protein